MSFFYTMIRWIPSSSLRRQLQTLVWVAITPLLLLALAENIVDRSRKEAEIKEHVMSLAHLAAGNLERYIDNTKPLLLVTSLTEVVQKGDPPSVNAFLRDIHQRYPEYANFGVADLQGNIFASALPMKIPVNTADLYWFQQTLKSRAFTVGEYQIGRITGIEVIVFAHPVFDRAGQMKFVLFASMDLNWLNRIWKNIQLLPDSTLTATDRNGTILFRYPLPNGFIGKNLAQVPIIKAMLAQEKGLTETDGLDETNRIYAFTVADSPDSKIHLAVGAAKAAVLAPIQHSLILNLTMILLVILFGLFLAKLFCRRFIMKPIKALQEATSRFAAGDFSHRINLSDGDNELIALTQLVDRMAESIEAERALREKTEGLTKTILDSVDEGFIIIDPEYRIVSANRAFGELVKAPASDIIGRHCHEVAHHLDQPCFMTGEECAVRLTFSSGEPHRAIHTHYDHEKNQVYVELKSYPMKDGTGQVTAVIETLINITETRKLENQLRHAQKMEAIGTIAGGIAHDFNNLLNVIIGYAGMLEMHMSPDDPQLHGVQEILKAGDRAAQLTRGLLTFSRKQVMEIKTVNLNDIVDGFKKMLSRIIGEDIDLRVVLSNEELIAKVDMVQIEQVLMNLAANARDAMPQGGALTIETALVEIDRAFIKMHRYGEIGRYALITVADTGTGMDQSTQEKIFEPYFTTKGIGQGTGLGLAIVYGIVTGHNGYIHCYSETGQGTTFRIFIPLVVAVAEKIETVEAIAPPGGTETVLLAEDDAHVRDITKAILEEFGYTVIEAVEGHDAVERFKANKDKIRLLLFDLIMPGKNGKDAYEEIKMIQPDIRIIFISGYTMDIIQRIGIEAGIEFISKPVLPTVLLLKVRDELDR